MTAVRSSSNGGHRLPGDLERRRQPSAARAPWAAVSRARAARRRHDAAGQAALEGRPGRDRPAGRAAAARLGARLGDERQDDDRGDGRGDPAAARRGWRTTPRARTSSRASPPPCSPRAAPSSACSRSTRRALPEVARRVRPRAIAARQPVPRPARPLRRAGADRRALAHGARRRSRTTLLVVNADDPLLGELARGRERLLTFGRRRPARTRGPRCSTRPTRPTASRTARRTTTRPPTSAISATTAAPTCGRSRLPLDVAAREIELRGLDGSAFTLVTPAGSARDRARAAGALQRLQRGGRGGARDRARRAAGRDRRRARSGSWPRSAASSGSRSATGGC